MGNFRCVRWFISNTNADTIASNGDSNPRASYGNFYQHLYTPTANLHAGQYRYSYAAHTHSHRNANASSAYGHGDPLGNSNPVETAAANEILMVPMSFTLP